MDSVILCLLFGAVTDCALIALISVQSRKISKLDREIQEVLQEMRELLGVN